MSIDSDTNWNLDYTVAPVSGKMDLYSVILHEIGHVLGLGSADSWDNLISNDRFGGTAAVAEHGGTVPLTEGGGHWTTGTSSTVFAASDSQDALMTPAISWASRKHLTDLDAAALDDIGWDINYPPAPPHWSRGDFNGDGTVDGIDAALMAANMQASAGNSSAAVPAPSTGILLFSALLMFALRPTSRPC